MSELTEPVKNQSRTETAAELHPASNESSLFGVSIRGLIAMILIVTVCLLSGFKIEIKEPLYTLSSMVAAFYFGHQIGRNNPPK